jgi:carbon-monoxide dehydrogenase medium subunit
MRPHPFVYESPTSVDEALDMLATHRGRASVLAGGQSLMPLLTQRLVTPERVIDIRGIEELQSITSTSDGLEIGAAVRQADVEDARAVRADFPLLAEALAHVGYRETRNAGTLCGALAYADPVSELPPTIVVLDGALLVASVQGRRTIPARDFFLGGMRTALADDELLLAVRLPSPSVPMGSCFMELSPRRGGPKGEFPVVGVAAAVGLRHGVVDRASFAYLGAGPHPCAGDHEATAMLVGRAPTDGEFDLAAQRAVAVLDPPVDVHADGDFRRHALRVLTRRALSKAAQRAAALQVNGA